MENLLFFILVFGVPAGIMTYLLCALWIRNLDLQEAHFLLKSTAQICCDNKTQQAIESTITEYFLVKTEKGEEKDLPKIPAHKIFSARKDYTMNAPVQKAPNHPKAGAFACPADQQALKKLFESGCANENN